MANGIVQTELHTTGGGRLRLAHMRLTIGIQLGSLVYSHYSLPGTRVAYEPTYTHTRSHALGHALRL